MRVISQDFSFLGFSPQCFLPPSIVLGSVACRLGAMIGKSGKPTIVLTESYHVVLLNSSATPMQMECGELFGFGTGQFKDLVMRTLDCSQ